MKIATWNVNSLKVRLPQVVAWLGASGTDVLCLQETKLIDDNFPIAALKDLGWHLAFSGQKTYNGVAILSRYPLSNIQKNIPGYEDTQQRVIAATVSDDQNLSLRVVCAYVPNGQSLESEKYIYKLAWLQAFETYIAQSLQATPELAVLGDFNIAPADEDVHDPAAWAGQVLCSAQERQAFEALLALGLKDSFRLFTQAEKSFSWWDYRMMGFRRNHGLRIDHILLSESLVPRCQACTIDKSPRGNEQPSDHTPVIATLL